MMIFLQVAKVIKYLIYLCFEKFLREQFKKQ